MNDINWKNLEFRVAKTMPENPHWYVVRSPENEADYVALWQANHERGQYEKWQGRRYKCWRPGDGFKYWYMGGIKASHVINKAQVEGDEPHPQ